MYEALSGANPFRAGARDQLTVFRRQDREELPTLTIAGDSPGELSGFISALTSRFPSRRPQAARDALSWLDAIAGQWGFGGP